MGKKKKGCPIEAHKKYIEFLEKRVGSENYKSNVSKEEYEKSVAKLKKANLILRLGLVK